MKNNYILKTAGLLTVTAFLFSVLPLAAQQKDKEKKDKLEVRGQGNNNKEKVQGQEKGDDKKQDKSASKDAPGNSDKANKGNSKAISLSKGDNAPVHPGKANKVEVCHKGDGAPAGGVTISISENALKAHLAHGDVQGACTVANNETADGKIDTKTKIASKLFTEIEETRAVTVYGEDVIAATEERLAVAREKLDVGILEGTIPENAITESRQIISEAEEDLSRLKEQVKNTKLEIDQAVSKAATIFK